MNEGMELNPSVWKSSLPKQELITRLNNKFKKCKGGIFPLNGSLMKTCPEIFKVFQQELKFPSYFGNNTSAFFECMTDMSWKILDSYFVIIDHAEELLSNEKQEIGWFLKMCLEISTEWSKPIDLGESWDRPAKPFAFIFLFSDEAAINSDEFNSITLFT